MADEGLTASADREPAADHGCKKAATVEPEAVLPAEARQGGRPLAAEGRTARAEHEATTDQAREIARTLEERRTRITGMGSRRRLTLELSGGRKRAERACGRPLE